MRENNFYGDAIPVCDYEGSNYRSRFWQGQGRDYEDLAERIAIRRLLPPTGSRLLEIGTGFGRLVDMYAGYRQLILLDYSKSLLREAQNRLGREPRYLYLAANVYQLPLADGAIDTVSMVRVMHHMADVPGALRQIRRVLNPGGVLLLEFASKHHWKSILRYAIRHQSWSPYTPEPVEFVALNFDFHPRWMQERLVESGLEVEHIRTVSRFRLPLLKRFIPARILARLDGLLQGLGRWWQLTPSVFVRARREGPPAPPDDRNQPADLLICPACAQQDWAPAPDALHCLACGARWAIDDGIYDLKSPLPPA